MLFRLILEIPHKVGHVDHVASAPDLVQHYVLKYRCPAPLFWLKHCDAALDVFCVKLYTAEL